MKFLRCLNCNRVVAEACADFLGKHESNRPPFVFWYLCTRCREGSFPISREVEGLLDLEKNLESWAQARKVQALGSLVPRQAAKMV